jgi:hypothetical protein
VCCDNRDCIYYDDYRGCDVDELVIDHGVCAGSAGHGRNVSQNDLDERLRAENLQLRQRMDKLIRILNNDYDLSIQLDGLRKFWHIGLTDEGVRKRDERDAENGKLKELVRDLRLQLSYAYDSKELVEYDERLKELGIEVD